MEIGVPKEVRDLEARVGLTPAGVLALTQAGHTLYVERDAGARAGFSDEDYRRAGAQIVFSAAEAYGRADIVAKFTRPTATEHALFRPGQTIFSFLHLSVASPDLLAALIQQEITAIAYELIEEEDGTRPVLQPASQIAGRLTPVIAGQLLTSVQPPAGRGILLGGLPGVPPAAVVILGGGVLGTSAARAFVGLGAQVTVLDTDTRKLAHLDELLTGRVTTMISNEYNLNRAVQFADVLIGAVMVPGRRAPVLVSREMVRHMRPGSVIIDYAIDQGGCVETSRPTTLRDQTFIVEGVIHHCVPTMTAVVGRTTSYAITNAALPYIAALANRGPIATVANMPGLAKGVNLLAGELVHPDVAAALNRDVTHHLSVWQS
ncbi:MAG: alanine dehydrogenase [Candidatus Promineifilaceae bacterium]|nr:alanine dehydrogenase [Candidatus Promineifilaceae bacterium]